MAKLAFLALPHPWLNTLYCDNSASSRQLTDSRNLKVLGARVDEYLVPNLTVQKVRLGKASHADAILRLFLTEPVKNEFISP